MKNRCQFFALLTFVAFATAADAQPKKPAPKFIRLNTNGPNAMVTSLVFNKEGTRLYSAGLDKIVRVWVLNEQTGTFAHDPKKIGNVIRIPISGAMQGAINALALSADGKWLAIGGLGVVRGLSGIGQPGILWPAPGSLSDEMKIDQGVIFVLNLQTNQMTKLRGHSGHVSDLSFMPAKKDAQILVSAAVAQRAKNTKATEVMVWDVAKSARLSTLSDQPYVKMFAPKLRAVPPVIGNDVVRVALALGDGKLRFWNAGKNDVVTLQDSPTNNVPAVSVNEQTGKQVFYSGAYNQPNGIITAWDVTGRVPQKLKETTLLERKNGNVRSAFYPRALTIVARKYAATIALERRNTKANPNTYSNRKYYLRILELSSGITKLDLPLWSRGYEPKIAVSSDGRFLAATGGADHEIHVFSVADLKLAQNGNKNANAQILKSTADTIHRVAFVTKTVDKTKQIGLQLGYDAANKEKKVFNFATSKLSDDLAGWQATPRDNRFTITATGASVSVQWQGNQWAALKWPWPKKQITAISLSAKSTADIPLLAVAAYHTEIATPYIEIYNAKTGEQIRRFTGHVGPIRSIAFSEDGRLLASCATDQTIALWSLTDLQKTWQEKGRIAGFAVVKSKNGLQLQDFDGITDQSTKSNQVKSDYVIEAIHIKNKVIKPATPTGVYARFWLTNRGEALTLQVLDNNGMRHLKKVQVAQGIDVRPPLFQMFHMRMAGAANQQAWLGWTPLGDFDLSHADAGKVAGWHSNTGDAKKPTIFVALKQYQDKKFDLYRKGILNYLVKHGDRDAARKAQDAGIKKAPIKMAGVLPFSEVKEPGHDLNAFLLNYEPNAGDVVELQQLVGNKWQVRKKFKGAFAIQAKLALPKFPQDNRFRLVVKTDATHVLPTFTVRYEPGPPDIVYTDPEVQIVNNQEYSFKATVMPKIPDMKVRVELRHVVDGKLVNKDQKLIVYRIAKADTRAHKFSLKAGQNDISLVAIAEDVMGTTIGKSAVLNLSVFWTKKQLPDPPEIALHRATPFKAIPKREILIKKNGEQFKTDVPIVRIHGRIKAKTKITKAWWQDEKGKITVVKNFKKLQNSIVIEDDIPLKPGRQLVQFFAQTTTATSKPASVVAVYHPQLPAVAINQPKRTLFEEKLSLTGKLSQPDVPSLVPFPMKLVVYQDGVVAETLTLQSDAPTFAAKPISLKPLENNEIRVELEYAVNGQWKKTQIFDRLAVKFVRPPSIEKLVFVQDKKATSGELTAIVKSKSILAPSKTRLSKNNKAMDIDALRYGVFPGEKAGTWKLVFKKLPLTTGKNILKLWVSNLEHESLKPKQIAVEIKEPDDPPKILILTPAGKQFANRGAKMPLHFKVESASALTSIEIRGERKTYVKLKGDDLKNAQGKDYYEFNEPIILEPNEQSVKIHVWNKGGGNERELISVSNPALPVTPDITKVEVKDRKNDQWVEVAPSFTNEGNKSYTNLPWGHIRIHGIVRWRDADAVPKDKVHLVNIHVNDFRQIPIRLLPGNTANEKYFRSELFLNFAENRVEFELPNLPEDSQSMTQEPILMTCKNPIKGQNLHVVLIAPTFPNQGKSTYRGSELAEQVLSALKVKKEGKRLKSNAYNEIHFKALTGPYARGSGIWHMIFESTKNIEKRLIDQKSSDVFMFIYHGKQTVTADDVFLWTSNTKPGNVELYAIRLSELRSHFAKKMIGAQVMFFDGLPASAASVKRLPKIDNYWLKNLLDPIGVRFAAFGHQFDGKVDATTRWAHLLEQLPLTMPRVGDLKGLEKALGNSDKLRPPEYDRFIPPELNVRF